MPRPLDGQFNSLINATFAGSGVLTSTVCEMAEGIWASHVELWVALSIGSSASNNVRLKVYAVRPDNNAVVETDPCFDVVLPISGATSYVYHVDLDRRLVGGAFKVVLERVAGSELFVATVAARRYVAGVNV